MKTLIKVVIISSVLLGACSAAPSTAFQTCVDAGGFKRGDEFMQAARKCSDEINGTPTPVPPLSRRDESVLDCLTSVQGMTYADGTYMSRFELSYMCNNNPSLRGKVVVIAR